MPGIRLELDFDNVQDAYAYISLTREAFGDQINIARVNVIEDKPVKKQKEDVKSLKQKRMVAIILDLLALTPHTAFHYKAIGKVLFEHRYAETSAQPILSKMAEAGLIKKTGVGYYMHKQQEGSDDKA